MCVTDCTGDALEAALAAALDEVVLPALATPSPARQAEVHLHQSLSHPRDAPSATVLHLTVADGLLLLLLLLAPPVDTPQQGQCWQARSSLPKAAAFSCPQS